MAVVESEQLASVQDIVPTYVNDHNMNDHVHVNEQWIT